MNLLICTSHAAHIACHASTGLAVFIGLAFGLLVVSALWSLSAAISGIVAARRYYEVILVSDDKVATLP